MRPPTSKTAGNKKEMRSVSENNPTGGRIAKKVSSKSRRFQQSASEKENLPNHPSKLQQRETKASRLRQAAIAAKNNGNLFEITKFNGKQKKKPEESILEGPRPTLVEQRQTATTEFAPELPEEIEESGEGRRRTLLEQQQESGVTEAADFAPDPHALRSILENEGVQTQHLKRPSLLFSNRFSILGRHQSLTGRATAVERWWEKPFNQKELGSSKAMPFGGSRPSCTGLFSKRRLSTRTPLSTVKTNRNQDSNLTVPKFRLDDVERSPPRSTTVTFASEAKYCEKVDTVSKRRLNASGCASPTPLDSYQKMNESELRAALERVEQERLVILNCLKLKGVVMNRSPSPNDPGNNRLTTISESAEKGSIVPAKFQEISSTDTETLFLPADSFSCSIKSFEETLLKTPKAKYERLGKMEPEESCGSLLDGWTVADTDLVTVKPPVRTPLFMRSAALVQQRRKSQTKASTPQNNEQKASLDLSPIPLRRPSQTNAVVDERMERACDKEVVACLRGIQHPACDASFASGRLNPLSCLLVQGAQDSFCPITATPSGCS